MKIHYWPDVPNVLNQVKNVLVIDGYNDLPSKDDESAVDTIREMVAIKDRFDYIVIWSTELSEKIFQLVINLDYPHVTAFIPGVLNVKLQHAEIGVYPFWFVSTTDTYRRQEFIVNYDKKMYCFESLYGKSKYHRRYAKTAITANVPECVLQSEFLTKGSFEYGCVERNEWWEDDIVIGQIGDEFVTLNNSRILPSQVIPKKIYEQTAYSIICETSINNNFSFFTEKIAKPILAGRLFIVISGVNYLRNLRSLGFKTFDGIIDESYDTVEDDHKRWDMALEEIYKLTKQDQVQVLQQCQDIVEHNYNIILGFTFNAVDNKLATLREQHALYNPTGVPAREY